jgi:hypothetical protein
LVINTLQAVKRFNLEKLKNMKEAQHPFDEHFQRRLNDLESAVPNDLFDRLQARRGGPAPTDAPLRERLEGHESPVSATVFDDILAERERRKRRRALWWRSALALAALLCVGFIGLKLNPKNKALETSQTPENGVYTEGSSSELKIKNSKLETTESAAKTVKMSEKGVYTEGSSFELKIKNSKLETTEPASKTVKMSEKGIYTEGSSSELKIKNSKLGMTESALNTAKSAAKTVKMTEKGIYTEESSFELKIKNSKLGTDNAAAKMSQNGVYTEGSSSEVKTDFENRLTPYNSTTKSLDFLNINAPKSLTILAENRKNPCSEPGNGCPTFGMRRNKNIKAFYIDAFVAPEYIARSFTTHLPESEKLLTARDTVERTQYAVSTGVRASVVFASGLSLRTGLTYNQINEQARFDSLGVGSITTTYKVNTLPNGVLDTVSITTTIVDGIFRKTRNNHYRSIDIPVQIGYEIRKKNGWSYGFNAGANINIAAWRKADIVGTNLRQLNVSGGINTPNPVFSTSLGVNFIGSFTAYRQLTSGLQLVIEPSIRYGLQPITRTDYALKQQYTTAGLLVGLRLRL